MLPRTVVIALAIMLATSGCLLASVREPPRPPPPTLHAAKVHSSIAAPMLPILVLRVARDELGLDAPDRAAVSMILEEAQARSHVMLHARAAFLEILAQSVEAGSVDELDVALYAEQVEWAAGESADALHPAMVQLFDVLAPAQREALVSKVNAKLPLWAATWATHGDHRWLEAFPRRELPDFRDDLVRTSRSWADESAASVRKALPGLDPSRRQAYAASLRTGHVD